PWRGSISAGRRPARGPGRTAKHRRGSFPSPSLDIRPVLRTRGPIRLFVKSFNPFLFETLDGVSLNPIAEGPPYDLRSFKRKRSTNSIDLGQRLFVYGN